MIRRKLSQAYAAAGRHVEAEFLAPESFDPDEPSPSDTPNRRWTSRFIGQMLTRAEHPQGAFDRLMLSGSYSAPRLRHELGVRQLLEGSFAAAAKTFRASERDPELAPGVSGRKRYYPELLPADPFLIHIQDCRVCDMETEQLQHWTRATFAERLRVLQRRTRRGGDSGAEAALELGTGLYNLSWYGNVRVLLQDTHQDRDDTRTAERWYARAFRSAQSRELKAKAAFLAAKAELGQLFAARIRSEQGEPIQLLRVEPFHAVPTRWYPVLQNLADTQYYQEVLQECGWYRDWTASQAAGPGREVIERWLAAHPHGPELPEFRGVIAQARSPLRRGRSRQILLAPAPGEPAADALRGYVYTTIQPQSVFAMRELTLVDSGTWDRVSQQALVSYGSPASSDVAARLVKAYGWELGPDGITLGSRAFVGAHLVLIAARANPAAPSQPVLIYTAASDADLVGIHDVPHGPTEWVVARRLEDGRFETVASGNFDDPETAPGEKPAGTP